MVSIPLVEKLSFAKKGIPDNNSFGSKTNSFAAFNAPSKSNASKALHSSALTLSIASSVNCTGVTFPSFKASCISLIVKSKYDISPPPLEF